MNILIAYLCGLATLPGLIGIYLAAYWWVDSKWFPFADGGHCLVCDRTFRWRFQFFFHMRFNRYHVDHYREWVLKMWPREHYANTDKYLDDWNHIWFRLHEKKATK